MKVIVVLAALLLVSMAAVPTNMPNQWKSSLQLKTAMKMSMGPTANADIGAFKAAVMDAVQVAPLQNVHRQLLQLPPMDMSTYINVDGTLFYDFPNNKMRTDISEISIEMMGNSFKVSGDGTQVLRYDQHKNFTWYKDQHGKQVCECSDLTETINPMFVPEDAQEQQPKNIKLPDGSNPLCNIYTIDMTRGPVAGAASDLGIKMSFEFAVDGIADGKPRVVSFKSTFAMSGMLSMEFTFLMWNYELGQPTMDSFVVSDLCQSKCPSPPKPNTEPKDKLVCPSTVDGCKCPKAGEELTYCKAYVNYPFDRSLDVKSTDSFVNTVMQQADSMSQVLGGSLSADCKEKLWTFYCQFYFQRCNKGGITYVPATPDLSVCPAGFGELVKNPDAHKQSSADDSPILSAAGLSQKLASFFSKAAAGKNHGKMVVRSSGQLASGDDAKRQKIGSAFQTYQAVFGTNSNEPNVANIIDGAGGNGGAIAGGIIGALLGVGLVAGGVWYYQKRYLPAQNRHSRLTEPLADDDDTDEAAYEPFNGNDAI